MLESNVFAAPMYATPIFNQVNTTVAHARKIGLRRVTQALLCALLLTALTPMARAGGSGGGGTIWTVNTLADTNDGSCSPWPGVCSLRDAILAANAHSGDGINLTKLVGRSH